MSWQIRNAWSPILLCHAQGSGQMLPVDHSDNSRSKAEIYFSYRAYLHFIRKKSGIITKDRTKDYIHKILITIFVISSSSSSFHDQMWSQDRFAVHHLIISLHIYGLKFEEVFIHPECIGQVDLAQPILLKVKLQSMFSNLKTSFGHGHVFVPYICEGGIIHPGP